MIVGSGLPASDFNENISACKRTPSLMTLAVRKSILSGALNVRAACCCGAAAGSGGRAVCCARAMLAAAKTTITKTKNLFSNCFVIVSVPQYAHESSASGLSRLSSLLQLTALGREHQLDQLFGDFWLKPFGVPFLKAHDIGHDTTVLAIGIDE